MLCFACACFTSYKTNRQYMSPQLHLSHLHDFPQSSRLTQKKCPIYIIGQNSQTCLRYIYQLFSIHNDTFVHNFMRPKQKKHNYYPNSCVLLCFLMLNMLIVELIHFKDKGIIFICINIL